MSRHLDGILEHLPCAVLVVEGGGRISLANPQTRQLLGVSAGEAPPPWLRQMLEGAEAGGAELECRLPGRNRAWLAVRRAQLSASDGERSIFILQDTSERKRLQLEQERLRRRRAVTEMSAVLAHEVRNPLASMELFAGLLAESELNPQQSRWIGHLQAGLRSLAATVTNVLHFHTGPAAQPAPTDLGELLDALVQFLGPQAAQAQVEVELRHSLHGVVAEVDRHGLEQVILNLARNAFCALPGGGRLTIAGHGKEERGVRWAQLAVADSGPGIAPETLARIFDPGFTTRPGSLGLGLAVAKVIVEQHDGALWVESEPGRGATFVLEFPLAQSAQGTP